MNAEARPYAVEVKVTTTLAQAPCELRGTTGYFRPETAHWSITRGSQWARDDLDRDRAWGQCFASVEVRGTKTRAPRGGRSGAFYRADELPEWLAAQRPQAVKDVEAFVAEVSR